MAENEKNILENIGEQEYKYGFTTDIETETIGKGLSEEVVRLIFRTLSTTRLPSPKSSSVRWTRSTPS